LIYEEVVEKGLCLGCGTCAGVCPTRAIKMKASDGLFMPEVSREVCNECQLCSKSCPGGSVDFGVLKQRIFSRKLEHSSVGNYSNIFTGYSNDDQIRFDSSSGGILTQLLIFALENKMIDGAIVTRMRKDNPLEPESFIARTREEIVDASGSKYCPVATNACLDQVLKEDGRFAIVGLPCHLHGVRKAEALLRPLEKRIVLHFGLLCSHTVDFAGTYFLLKKLGIEKDEVSRISYRGGGWPGSMSIKKRNASEVRLPLVGSWHAYWPLFSSFFFTPMRCTMCPDQAAELADISFGDAWLPELKQEKRGVSIIISRTDIGQNLIDRAVSAKAITLNPVNVDKVLKSQFVNMKFKKDDLRFRLSLMRLRGKETPIFIPEVPPSNSAISAFLRSMYIYSSIRTSSNKNFLSFLQYVPLSLIRLYYGIYKSLCTI
jgi:coenzyme F420 hydrogenase subunit beta